MFEQRIAPPADSSQLLARATALAGLTLAELATQLQRPLPADLRRNKGVIGQYLELALGADGGARPEPDFAHLGIELKTIPIGADGQPLETTYVCTAPLSGIAGERWQTSLLKRKLSQVLWLPIEGQRQIPLAQRRIGQGFLWQMNPHWEQQLRADYEELMELLALGQLDRLHARHGQWLQLRPKAANSRVRTAATDADGLPVTINPRGFYLRKAFTATLLASHLQR
ncbi:MAG: DNA mismatch repair endonuclease MutH [Gammaproteobacteria bacterium]|nr:DNA mismatch repair endonuclease MutH [Gammaproteobacteria bacterium]